LFNQTLAQPGQLGQFSDINDGAQLDPNTPNGGSVSGDIQGSMILLMEVFGETCMSMSVKAFESVFLENKFPSGYRFPSPRKCPPQLLVQLEVGPPFLIGAAADGIVAPPPPGVKDLDAVICPFLRTMLATGALPVQDTYTREELEEFTMEAGVPSTDAALHAEGNFGNVPSSIMDLFDMEGNPNEHQTSTGIVDCPTPFPATVGNFNACQFFDPILQQLKCVPTPNCASPARSRRLFGLFFNAADISPTDGIITVAELVAAEVLFNPMNLNQSALAGLSDINDGAQFNNGLPVPIEGAIAGSNLLLIEVFGETCTTMKKTSFENIFLEAKYPPNYRFPSKRLCPNGLAALIAAGEAEGEGEALVAAAAAPPIPFAPPPKPFAFAPPVAAAAAPLAFAPPPKPFAFAPSVAAAAAPLAFAPPPKPFAFAPPVAAAAAPFTGFKRSADIDEPDEAGAAAATADSAATNNDAPDQDASGAAAAQEEEKGKGKGKGKLSSDATDDGKGIGKGKGRKGKDGGVERETNDAGAEGVSTDAGAETNDAGADGETNDVGAETTDAGAEGETSNAGAETSNAGAETSDAMVG
jgi:hypothetical protein